MAAAGAESEACRPDDERLDDGGIASSSSAAERPQLVTQPAGQEEVGERAEAEALCPSVAGQPHGSGRKGSDASLTDSVAACDEPAMSKPLLACFPTELPATAGAARAACADGKTSGWPQYGCSDALPAAGYKRAGRCASARPRWLAADCSLQRGSHGKLVLVGLNAAHVVLGASVASLAAGAYVVATSSVAGADASSPAACFTCIAFVATGTFGLYQVLVKGNGRRCRPQRIVYTCMSVLSGAAALIVASYAAKQLAAVMGAGSSGDACAAAAAAASDEGRMALAACSCILLLLTAIELAVAGAACHRQSWQRRRRGGGHYGVVVAATSSDESLTDKMQPPTERYARCSYERSRHCSDAEWTKRQQRRRQLRQHRERQQQTSVSATATATTKSHRWLLLLLVMFNAAHVAVGICTLELALVGMTLAGRVADAGTAGLFAAALVSPLFLAAGCHGLYAIFARRLTIRPVRLAYLVVCSAAAIGSLIAAGLLAAGAIERQWTYLGQQQPDWLLPVTVLEGLLWLAAGAEVLVSAAAVAVYQVYARRSRCSV